MGDITRVLPRCIECRRTLRFYSTVRRARNIVHLYASPLRLVDYAENVAAFELQAPQRQGGDLCIRSEFDADTGTIYHTCTVAPKKGFIVIIRCAAFCWVSEAYIVISPPGLRYFKILGSFSDTCPKLSYVHVFRTAACGRVTVVGSFFARYRTAHLTLAYSGCIKYNNIDLMVLPTTALYGPGSPSVMPQSLRFPVNAKTVTNVVASATYWDLSADGDCGVAGCDPRFATVRGCGARLADGYNPNC